uniref:Uncharacterized protein n=1 Tax=Chenopodium quinoa TaxID=63459 RepID=A0A803L2D0_CHEQI
MAISSNHTHILLTFSLLLTLTLTLAEIRSDSRPIIPFDEFGFTHTGKLDLNVPLLSLRLHKNDQTTLLTNPKPNDLSLVGFFLSTRDSWYHVVDQLNQNDIVCALQSDLIKPVFSFDRLNNGGITRFNVSLQISNPNLYTLVFANCIPNLHVSMDVHSSMYNLEGKSSLIRDYLSAGLNLLCEAEDKSYIKKTGSAHGWDVLFYIFSFLKGITLFTLIVLIGTGWSFLKPFLQDKEKKVLMIVIPLQVVANVAQVVIDETGPNLREAATTDGKAAVNLMKLTLFRHYYVVVVGEDICNEPIKFTMMASDWAFLELWPIEFSKALRAFWVQSTS